MLKHLLKPTFLIAATAFIACSFSKVSDVTGTADDDGGGTNKGKPYTVTGKVVDTKGNPIAGARVRADNDALYGSAETTTDENGVYTLPKLEIGGYKIYAWNDVTYNGKEYHLRLGMPKPSDYNAFSTDATGAVVKNFVWVLQGKIPDRPRSERNSFGYWGGTIHFSTMDENARTMPDGTELTITLTPETGAALFDGSTPATITKTFTLEGGESNYYLYDVPQCKYKITATSVTNGTKHNITLALNWHGPYQTALSNIYFQPDGSGRGSYENGLGSASHRDDPISLHQE